MSLHRLRWATIIVAITFLVLVQGVAMGFVMPTFGRAYGHAVSITGFGAGIVVLATLLYNTIDRMQARIVRQNEESEALYKIAVDIAALDDERQVLRSIVDRAREMLGADAAVLYLTGPSGALVAAAHAHPPGVSCGQGAVADGERTPTTESIGGIHCPLADPALDGISADLVTGGERVGELCVSAARPRTFGEEDLR